jgi:hypothetical protein
MAMPLMKLVSFLAFRIALSSNEDSYGLLSDGLSVQSMAKVFERSELTRQMSMAAISRTMTIPKAMEVLHHGKLMTPALVQVTDMAFGGRHLRRQAPKKGYGGIEGARKLLNDMIFESMSKYDAEIAKCTEFYSRQCAAMESCRGQIAASNYIAANSRALILDAQATINKCEEDIPTRKLELSQHLLKCKHELHKMNARLKIILGDIAVMTMILKMTDCEKKTFADRKVGSTSLPRSLHEVQLYIIQSRPVEKHGGQIAIFSRPQSYA